MATIETYARPVWLHRYRSLKADPTNGYRADPAQLKRELDAIRSGHIYCSTYKEMNDPMEGFFRSSSRVREHPDYEHFKDRVRDEKLYLGIASLSETWNNELMWAHYSDAFYGICVQYSVSKLLAKLHDECAFARVAYGDKPHYLNLRGMENEDARARAILSTKNLKWSYEREWRLFSPAPGEVSHDPKAILCVYLGMRMVEADRKIIERRLRGTNIQVRQTFVRGYSVRRHTKPKGE